MTQTEQTISWQQDKKKQTATWQSSAGNPPPKQVVVIDDTTKADVAYKQACEGVAMLYQGDFQNGKHLLQAVTRRMDRKKAKPAASLLEAFHQHRARQIGRANIANKILIELNEGQSSLNRAPALQEAVAGALLDKPEKEKLPKRMVLSLRELLGMNGANEWRKKGVSIPAIDGSIHAYYGVYSPVRGEYLDLIDQEPLNDPRVVWDIGTGTGVIAALLVTRGVKQIIATDNSPRALACAKENIERLGMQKQVELVEADLFPKNTTEKADLIVCNPPWLPAKANAVIERAVYDPNSEMLKGYLNGVKEHLSEQGEAWLIMSNLAELIGLRGETDLQDWITQAGLAVVEKRDTTPKHAKATDKTDPLYQARVKEVTSLYRLQAS